MYIAIGEGRGVNLLDSQGLPVRFVENHARLLQHHRVFTHSIRYARVDLGLRVNFEGVLPLDKKDPSILSGRRRLLSILLSLVRESFLVTD